MLHHMTNLLVDGSMTVKPCGKMWQMPSTMVCQLPMMQHIWGTHSAHMHKQNFLYRRCSKSEILATKCVSHLHQISDEADLSKMDSIFVE
jgi:hypothetical protein